MAENAVAPGSTLRGEVVEGKGLSFRVEEEVGSDANARLYRANDGKRAVALKLVHGPIGRDARFREALESEIAKAARIMSHRALRAHASGIVEGGAEVARGWPFVATEWIDGEHAAARVARLGPMPAWSASSILEQLAELVSSAHAVGVIHRDLTPEKLWLVPAPPSTEPALKVAFSGVSKLASEVKRNTLAAMARAAWMAPEQTETAIALGPSTDIWTYGLIAYWLLTGRQFWRGNDEMSLLREVMYDAIPKPSERAAEQGVGALLPPGFDAWFARAVAKRPKDRFAIMREAFDGLLPLVRYAIDHQRASYVPRPPVASARPAVAVARELPSAANAPAQGAGPTATLVEAPSPKLVDQERAPATIAAAPLTEAPLGAAPTPAAGATPISVRRVSQSSPPPPPRPVGEAIAPVRVEPVAPAPRATVEPGSQGDPNTTQISPAEPPPSDRQPPPKRVDDPAAAKPEIIDDIAHDAGEVARRGSVNDTFITGPPAMMESSGTTRTGFAQPATPVTGTLTEPIVAASAIAAPPVAESKPADAPKNTDAPPDPTYAGALARFASPPAGSAAPSPYMGPSVGPQAPPAHLPPAGKQFARLVPVAGRIEKLDPAAERVRKRRLYKTLAIVAAVILVFGGIGAGLTLAFMNSDTHRSTDDDKDKGPDDSRDRKKRSKANGPWADIETPVPVSNFDPMWGDRYALVTVVDFVDYESISSRLVEQELIELRKKYRDVDLRIVWKERPAGYHAMGQKAAVAGQAVFELTGNTGYLKFHDSASTNAGTLDDGDLQRWLTDAGLTRDQGVAVNAPANRHKVDEDGKLADRMGESEGGVLYINGRRYDRNTGDLGGIIDAALAEAKKEAQKGTSPDQIYNRLSTRHFEPRSPDPTRVPVPITPTDPQPIHL